jgi:hypothetical protein
MVSGSPAIRSELELREQKNQAGSFADAASGLRAPDRFLRLDDDERDGDGHGEDNPVLRCGNRETEDRSKRPLLLPFAVWTVI